MNTTSHPVAVAGEKPYNNAPLDGPASHDVHPSLFNRISGSRLFQRILRTLQFLSAFISLILFSIRVRKILRLAQRAQSSTGAVEGILAAAVLYTLLMMLLKFLRKGSGGKMASIMTWITLALDLAFVGAFIAVAVLTSSGHGYQSGACNSDDGRLNNAISNSTGGRASCKLPWGTFGLAIFSTLLHALTAIFRKTKEHRQQKRLDREARGNGY